MEAGWEWVVSLDALQAIECRMLDEPGIQHQIAVDVPNAATGLKKPSRRRLLKVRFNRRQAVAG